MSLSSNIVHITGNEDWKYALEGEKILTGDKSRMQVVADVVGGLKGEQGGLWVGYKHQQMMEEEETG